MFEDLKIEVGKTYKIVSYNNVAERTPESFKRRSAVVFLAHAPFSISRIAGSIDDESFKIYGHPENSFPYSLFDEFDIRLVEAEPLKWEEGKIYEIGSGQVEWFETCFGYQNRTKQLALLQYLHDEKGKFTVKKVTSGGSVLEIFEASEQPPNHATYVLEDTDRRYFTEVGFRDEVAAAPEPLEKKLRAFFVLQQGARINISNERDGSNDRFESYDAFVSWLDKTLENGVIDLKSTRRRYEENLDTVNKITETINAALKG